MPGLLYPNCTYVASVAINSKKIAALCKAAKQRIENINAQLLADEAPHGIPDDDLPGWCPIIYISRVFIYIYIIYIYIAGYISIDMYPASFRYCVHAGAPSSALATGHFAAGPVCTTTLTLRYETQISSDAQPLAKGLCASPMPTPGRVPEAPVAVPVPRPSAVPRESLTSRPDLRLRSPPRTPSRSRFRG